MDRTLSFSLSIKYISIDTHIPSLGVICSVLMLLKMQQKQNKFRNRKDQYTERGSIFKIAVPKVLNPALHNLLICTQVTNAKVKNRFTGPLPAARAPKA